MSTPKSWSGGGRREVDKVGWSWKVTEMGWGTDKDKKGKKGGYTMTPGLRCMVGDYVRSCTSCACTKVPHHKPYGLLKQLPIPSQPWESISMDFIEQLPTLEGFTVILVIMDRLTKQLLFIPTLSHSIMAQPRGTKSYAYPLDDRS